MKEIKAYIHRNRIANVIQALKDSEPFAGRNGASHHNLTAHPVKGSLSVLNEHDRHYSLDLGDSGIDRYKLEFVCRDEDADVLVSVIRETAHTGRGNSGWVYVTDVLRVERIE
ncbi:MAG: P-II family nitrogen regulator [Azoarcus sp.]|jgi:nitrogen regulatory protein P-II 1|nr:P-II family nitrogen regulator [Azoarcus sp.]